jgi:acyl carrier protein
MPAELSAQQSDKLRRNFKRCGEETIEAILKFRQDGGVSAVPLIARGIISRYLRDEAKEAIASAAPETPLSSLGVDSLTMLEIILDVQEALDISIEDSELKGLQTIGDVYQLLMDKAAAQGRAA